MVFEGADGLDTFRENRSDEEDAGFWAKNDVDFELRRVVVKQIENMNTHSARVVHFMRVIKQMLEIDPTKRIRIGDVVVQLCGLT